jgi:UDP-N-acetylmuramoylalanine--D-glutamate ligase
LELSSFQLINLKSSPHIAACLMVVPEHLDWHADEIEYQQAKAQLFTHQTAEDLAIYYAENAVSKEIASHGDGQKIPYYASPGAVVDNDVIRIGETDICRVDELKLLGAHNWQNVCAAVTIVWHANADTQNVEAMRSVLTTFSGLEYRLELIRELDGVKYYNDSFGTTPETAIVAMQAFDQPKLIILGGSDKGATYQELAKAVAGGNVRAALLIGEQADRIKAALDDVGFTAYTPGGQSMSDIVTTARGLAQPGDVVLLSTACASFDMFQNYKDRGRQFTEAVQALA